MPISFFLRQEILAAKLRISLLSQDEIQHVHYDLVEDFERSRCT